MVTCLIFIGTDTMFLFIGALLIKKCFYGSKTPKSVDQGWGTNRAQPAIIGCMIFLAGHITFKFRFENMQVYVKIYQLFIVSYSLP